MMHPKLTFGLVDGPTGLKITVKDCQVTQIEIWFLIFALLVWEWVFVELNEDEKLTRLTSTTQVDLRLLFHFLFPFFC